MYSMKEVCQEVQMPYETLKYYCKEGLIPNVARDQHNYRIFDEHNIAWIKSIQCLRKCGLSMDDMKQYMAYYHAGPSTIPQRMQMLETTRTKLQNKEKEIVESLCYINEKQTYYEAMLLAETPSSSNVQVLQDEKKDSK